MKEKIIVSLTSYGERLNNLPVVLDTMYAQTLPPDLVVLNLAYEEILPKDVENYLRSHNVEINRVADTKVYKKIIPTLKKYPNDCVICIDDDWLYPKQMIEDFVNIHKHYPNNPISGNRVIINGMQCHCGCASLIKKEYFGEYLDLFSEDIFDNCKSDDMFYTYCATKSGHPYVRTKGLYFINMQSFNAIDSYTDSNLNCIFETLDYLNYKYGRIDKIIEKYLQIGCDDCIIKIVNEIEEKYRQELLIIKNNNLALKTSKSYRLGHFILSPLIGLKQIIKKKSYE